MGGTEKTGGETDFKKGRQTGSKAGCLKKKGGLDSRTMQHLNRLYKLYMLHASAAFKGGDIQNFWEGGKPYMGGLDNP